MNLTKSENRMARALYAALFLLQLLLLFSFAALLERPKPAYFAGVAAIELLLIFLLIAIRRQRWPSIAISIFLLLLGNFIVTPFTNPERAVTLPPNLKLDLLFENDAYIGIKGAQRITTDEKGFRVTRPIDYTNKSTALRVFAIGGSTTEQIYVDDQKTWSSLLEKMLEMSLGRTVEVINTGVSGLRASHHLSTFHKILPYHPDAVVFLMGINDWNKQIAEEIEQNWVLPAWIKRFSIRNSPLWNIGKLGAAPKTLAMSEATSPQVFGAPSFPNSLARGEIKQFQPQNVSVNYSQAVESIMRLCADRGIRCFFVTQPHAYDPNISERLKLRLWMTPPNESYTLSLDNIQQIAKRYNAWLIESSKRQQQPLCDLASILPATEAIFYDDCHFNESGSVHVAEALHSCLLPYFK